MQNFIVILAFLLALKSLRTTPVELNWSVNRKFFMKTNLFFISTYISKKMQKPL